MLNCRLRKGAQGQEHSADPCRFLVFLFCVSGWFVADACGGDLSHLPMVYASARPIRSAWVSFAFVDTRRIFCTVLESASGISPEIQGSGVFG